MTNIDEKIMQAKLEEAAKQLLNGNEIVTIRELKGITDSEMEAIYSIGYNLYSTGRYDDAEKIFKFLALFDHVESKYWIGLGAVNQVKKRYDRAIIAYALASFLNIENPKPQYHVAECYIANGDKVNAISALDALEEFAPKTAEGAEWRRKAAALRARIA